MILICPSIEYRSLQRVSAQTSEKSIKSPRYAYEGQLMNYDKKMVIRIGKRISEKPIEGLF